MRKILVLTGIIIAFSMFLYTQIDDEPLPNHDYNEYNSSKSLEEIYKEAYSTDSPNKALTAEEADKLRGTGYHNTEPNSSAENLELQAAQVKCIRCGMHSDNGANSMCDTCREELKAAGEPYK